MSQERFFSHPPELSEREIIKRRKSASEYRIGNSFHIRRKKKSRYATDKINIQDKPSSELDTWKGDASNSRTIQSGFLRKTAAPLNQDDDSLVTIDLETDK